MNNCLNLIPILNRPEYRIRWKNSGTINLYLKNNQLKTNSSLTSEILNLGADLIVEKRYKVTQFVIGGPPVGSWKPWEQELGSPLPGAALNFYIQGEGKNWFKIQTNGSINVNTTDLKTLIGLKQLNAKVVISLSGPVPCETSISTTVSRYINIIKVK
jgi:hypothetical protein